MTQLHSNLADLRRKVIRTGATGGIAWAVLAGVVLLLVAMWLDLVVELPSDLRVSCNIAALLGGGLLLAKLLISTIRSATPAAIASRLDDAGQARGEIVSGVDLALHPTAGAAVTTGLAAIAIDRAADLVRSVPMSSVAPSRLGKPLAWIGGLAAVVMLLAVLAPRLVATQWNRFADPYGDHPPYWSLAFDVQPGHQSVLYGGAMDVIVKTTGPAPDRVDLYLSTDGVTAEPLPMFPESNGQWRASLANITTPGQYFVRAGRARSHKYNLGVITVPKLEAVTFKVTLPAYTQRPPYEGPLPQGGLAGLPGTTVQVKAKSNRQLKAGTMTFSPTTRPAFMSPHTSQEVVGSFQIREAGKVTVGVTDIDGQAGTETFTAPISLLKDEKPFVRMTEPKPNSFATPDAIIGVTAVAEDDFGVAKVSVFRGLNDSRPRPTDIPVPTTRPTMFPAEMKLPLGDYGLRPGDVVKLFARVEDNDPAGGKGAESSIVTIHVISQAELDQMIVTREGLEAMESKYAAAARRLEAMAEKAQKLQDELAKLPPDSDLAAEKRKELEQLAKEMEHAAGEIEKSAKNELPIDLDKALTEELKKAADALRQAAKDTKDAAGQGMKSGGASKKLADAAKKLGGGREELKKNAQEPIEHLAKIMPLMEAEQRFLDLAAQQRELADRMSALENAKDDPEAKVRMRDLQEQQEQTRRELAKLLDDIDDAADKLPEDKQLESLKKQAKTFADKVRKSEAQGQMQQAENSLGDFAGPKGAMFAKQAAASLEKFISECNGMGEEGGMCMKFQPTLSKSLGNTVAQLLGSGNGGWGMGAGQGGFSARRSSLKNVGLYGSIPTRAAASSRSGNGRADRGVATRADGNPDANSNPDGTGGQHETKASGENDPNVPSQYKRRVGDYFRRVADELEN